MSICHGSLEDVLGSTKMTWNSVGKKGYFFRETLELLNRSSGVGDPF
jgi:hypothetical protein